MSAFIHSPHSLSRPHFHNFFCTKTNYFSDSTAFMQVTCVASGFTNKFVDLKKPPASIGLFETERLLELAIQSLIEHNYDIKQMPFCVLPNNKTNCEFCFYFLHNRLSFIFFSALVLCTN